jgi:hypothetical protein
MDKQQQKRTVRFSLREEEPTPQQRAAWMRWLASVAEDAARLTAERRESILAENNREDRSA